MKYDIFYFTYFCIVWIVCNELLLKFKDASQRKDNKQINHHLGSKIQKWVVQNDSIMIFLSSDKLTALIPLWCVYKSLWGKTTNMLDCNNAFGGKYLIPWK